MGIVDIAIIAGVVVVAAIGARRAIGTATGRRDCCTGDAKSSAKTFRPVKIKDVDEKNYPYHTELTIAGMTCENCVKHVTAALDSVEGTWATVDLETRKARILCKRPIDEAAYRAAVSDAGYRVIS